MLNALFWFVFGILGGWIDTLVAEPLASTQRVRAGILFGAAGGLIGGSLARLIRGLPLFGDFDPGSIFFAALFSIAFTAFCASIFLRKD